jgi:O-6-methylguanine DNA methyltransferase
MRVRSRESVESEAIISVNGQRILLAVTGEGLSRLVPPRGLADALSREDGPVDITIIENASGEHGEVVEETATFLEAFLSGNRPESSPPVDLAGLTPFTARVLAAAGEIPWGEVRSYGWLAERVGSPGGARAVGQALGRNPVPLLVPCHRVLRSDGSLGGFGLGPGFKEWLLALEARPGA